MWPHPPPLQPSWEAAFCELPSMTRGFFFSNKTFRNRIKNNVYISALKTFILPPVLQNLEKILIKIKIASFVFCFKLKNNKASDS
jgi:hypothetical protein